MSARRAAADVLCHVLDEGATLEAALNAAPSFGALEGRDRAFARAIVMASLRRLGRIDGLLARFLARPLPQSAHFARALLRSGAAQLLVLDAPAYAVVSETVAIAHATPAARGFAGLANAVLRRVAREAPAMFAVMDAFADLPAWLTTRWRAAYGDETARAIVAGLGREPPLDLTAKKNASDWAERLGAELLPTASMRLHEHDAPETLDGYGEGAWWVQDGAAALPARMLGDIAGKTVLDLCAAPGGKTMQLAAAGARVIALDHSQDRLARLHENLARTRLEAEIVCADALRYRPREPVDAILLDAPCTATGTLRRHPDIAWLRRPADVPKLAALQRDMIGAAASMLKPGGTLVYAVCSLEPEEGAACVDASLSAAGLTRSPLAPGELPGADEFLDASGALRTHPGQWRERGGLDGFYAARLKLAP